MSLANPVDQLSDYELRHLVVHLAHLGRAEDVHRLLSLETADQANAWFEAKSPRLDVASYAADLQVAWDLAATGTVPVDAVRAGMAQEDAPHAGVETKAAAIWLPVRYALMACSVRDRVGDLPANLVVALVAEGLWRPPQGLAQVRQMTDAAQRVRALTALLPLLEEVERAALIPEVEDAIWQIEGTHYQAEAAIALAPHLPPERLIALQRECLARELDPVDMAVGLAPHLPRSQQLRAYQDALVAPDAEARVAILVALAPHLPRAQQAIALERSWRDVQTIAEDTQRALLLTRLACVSPAPQRAEVCRAALNQVAAFHPLLSYWPARILTDLVPCLTHLLLPEALAVARNIYHENDRASALAALQPVLAEPERSAVLEDVLDYFQNQDEEGEDPAERAHLLTDLARGVEAPLRQSLLAAALDAVGRIESQENQAWAAANLAEMLELEQRQRLLTESLARARHIGDVEPQVLARAGMAAGLRPAALDRLVEDMLALRETYRLPQIAARMLPALGEQQLAAVLHGIGTRLQDPSYRLILPLLAPFLSAAQRTGLFQLATRIETEEGQLDILVDLAPYLDEPDRTSAIRRALRFSSELLFSNEAEVRSRLLPHMSPVVVTDLLDQARHESHAPARAQQLAAMVDYLPEVERTAVSLEALSLLEDSTDRLWPQQVIALAPYLPQARLLEILHRPPPGPIHHEDTSLPTLLPHLAESLLQQLLAAALEVADGRFRFWLLAELAPFVAPDGQQGLESEPEDEAYDLPERRLMLSELRYHVPEALVAAIEDESLALVRLLGRIRLCTGLAPFLEGPYAEDALAWAGEAIKELRDPSTRIMARTLLAVAMPDDERRSILVQALAEFDQVADEERAVEALATIAPAVPENLSHRLVDVVAGLENGWWRRQALQAVLPHLPTASLTRALPLVRRWFTAHDRVEILGVLVAFLPPTLFPAVHQIVREERAVDTRADMLALLVTAGQELDDETLSGFWNEMLRNLAEGGREKLLRSLTGQGHILEKLGGKAAVARVEASICDVGRWWP